MMERIAKDMPKYRLIFSLRIREQLRERGIEPLFELENFEKPGFKCWKYKVNEELSSALDEIMEGGRDNG